MDFNLSVCVIYPVFVIMWENFIAQNIDFVAHLKETHFLFLKENFNQTFTKGR